MHDVLNVTSDELGNGIGASSVTVTSCGARAYLASGFEHPASTLSTRFPAALGIGHDHACGFATAFAVVYVAA